MELWGGIECTVNRVGNGYRDQAHLTGHHDRLGDLALVRGLGIKRLRYPVLWERVSPRHPAFCDWRWSDERLSELRRLGIEPIVGLIHHGSGPQYTSLLSPEFARLFAGFAQAAAQRYPDVLSWTPVNEPLTTARFSALYGHWFPHTQDERNFWIALLNQIDATRLAMAAIRQVNTGAQLVQTEDLGETYSTSTASAVAGHYNERRWMTWDLLIGKVVPGHPLWQRICGYGLENRLRTIADDPCPPDVIGINHYVTSNRFLDDRDKQNEPSVGYDDVVAARAVEPRPIGVGGLVAQAWQRYGISVAITEAHLSCTREEQMRWFWQIWNECAALEREHVPVRAVTAWALLGAIDWCSLLTRDEGHYEPGAFDITGPTPRLTGLGRLLGDIASGTADETRTSIASAPGWWERPMRLHHAPYAIPAIPAVSSRPLPRPPILITGATGTLGKALAAGCELRGHQVVLTDRHTLALDNPASIARALDKHQPWAVINAAGWVRVDEAEMSESQCLSANYHGAIALAEACRDRAIHCTLFSSDLVFGDGGSDLWFEEDRTSPLSAYGRSKAAAEQSAACDCPHALVVRTAAFFSPYDRHNFAWVLERQLSAEQPFAASPDHVVTPTFVPDLVRATLDLVVDGESGIWNLTNGDPVSWFAFAQQLAAQLDRDPALVVAANAEQLGWRARRPKNAALGSRRGLLMPPLQDAIVRHVAERRQNAETL